MPSQELLAALNNIYYISMPMFNESAIAGAPAEVKAVFNRLVDGGSTIDDITAEIAASDPKSGVTPEAVYQLLTQLEQAGLVSHSEAVSGYNGMIISNSANNVLSSDSMSLGNMFSPERISPVLSSSQAIAELGAREDQAIINYQNPNPLANAANVQLTASTPEISVSDPNLMISSPQIDVDVPPVSSSPEIKASAPQIGFGQGGNSA